MSLIRLDNVSKIYRTNGVRFPPWEAFLFPLEKENSSPLPAPPVREDRLRKDSKTEVVLKKIDFDITILPDTFSERRLKKK